MTALVVIPARYGSTRFPGKVLAPLLGRPLLWWVHEAAVRARIGPVVVATEDRRVADAVRGFGGHAVMTPADLPSGTDRVHRVARRSTARWIVNLQGDEPLMDPATLRRLVALLKKDPRADIATAAFPIRDVRRLRDPNVVKVVLGARRAALYFSRSPIPYFERVSPNGGSSAWLQHVGIYAFRRPALERFVRLPPSRLEKLERLEQLRALECGMRIVVAEVPGETVAVDTPADLRKAERLLRRRKEPPPWPNSSS